MEITRRKFIKQSSITIIGLGLIGSVFIDASCSDKEKKVSEYDHKNPPSIIVLVGSSRAEGNTDLLVNKMIVIIEKNDLSVEKIYLKDKKILPCKLCNKCREIGRPQCIQDDDFNRIIKKIQLAEAIIMSSPVYWRSVSGVMKLFMERCYSQFDKDWKNSKIKGKHASLVVVSGDNNTEKQCAPIIESFTGFLNWNEISISGSVTASAVEKGEIINNAEALKNAEDEAVKLIDAIRR